MRKNRPRDVALLILNRDDSTRGLQDQYLNPLQDPYCWNDERDRAFALNVVQGVRRWKLRLDWIISCFLRFSFEEIEPQVLNILRIALYQIFFMDRVPQSAAVDEAVKQARNRSLQTHIRGFVNGILRRICREKNSIVFPDPYKEPVQYMSVYYSYPVWLVRKWIKEVGTERAKCLLDAGNDIPHITCRANLLRCDRERLASSLGKEEIVSRPTHYAPQGLILESLKVPIDSIKAFSEGLFQVQSEAAQICSYLLAPSPKDTILDLCAGLGGKSTHLAEIMGDNGKIVALDINPDRLHLLSASARRLGIRSVFPVVADAGLPLSPLFGCVFDKILVDGPCTGFGIISRHPEIKWRRSQSDVRRFAELQKRMLGFSVPLLKSGGRLLYVTCTISRQENEEVVRDFLHSQDEIKLLPLTKTGPSWAQELVTEDGFFRTYPDLHRMDGFFAALFVKK